ncbi:putative uncharacterized protein DDB_G0286901 [Folsomia candida]|nr:putative uncharacterized protein DDB_G0286901 [Folsomia candida]
MREATCAGNLIFDEFQSDCVPPKKVHPESKCVPQQLIKTRKVQFKPKQFTKIMKHITKKPELIMKQITKKPELIMKPITKKPELILTPPILLAGQNSISKNEKDSEPEDEEINFAADSNGASSRSLDMGTYNTDVIADVNRVEFNHSSDRKLSNAESLSTKSPGTKNNSITTATWREAEHSLSTRSSQVFTPTEPNTTPQRTVASTQNQAKEVKLGGKFGRGMVFNPNRGNEFPLSYKYTTSNPHTNIPSELSTVQWGNLTTPKPVYLLLGSTTLATNYDGDLASNQNLVRNGFNDQTMSNGGGNRNNLNTNTNDRNVSNHLKNDNSSDIEGANTENITHVGLTGIEGQDKISNNKTKEANNVSKGSVGTVENSTNIQNGSEGTNNDNGQGSLKLSGHHMSLGDRDNNNASKYVNSNGSREVESSTVSPEDEHNLKGMKASRQSSDLEIGMEPAETNRTKLDVNSRNNSRSKPTNDQIGRDNGIATLGVNDELATKGLIPAANRNNTTSVTNINETIFNNDLSHHGGKNYTNINQNESGKRSNNVSVLETERAIGGPANQTGNGTLNNGGTRDDPGSSQNTRHNNDITQTGQGNSSYTDDGTSGRNITFSGDRTETNNGVPDGNNRSLIPHNAEQGDIANSPTNMDKHSSIRNDEINSTSADKQNIKSSENGISFNMANNEPVALSTGDESETNSTVSSNNRLQDSVSSGAMTWRNNSGKESNVASINSITHQYKHSISTPLNSPDSHGIISNSVSNLTIISTYSNATNVMLDNTTKEASEHQVNQAQSSNGQIETETVTTLSRHTNEKLFITGRAGKNITNNPDSKPAPSSGSVQNGTTSDTLSHRRQNTSVLGANTTEPLKDQTDNRTVDLAPGVIINANNIKNYSLSGAAKVSSSAGNQDLSNFSNVSHNLSSTDGFNKSRSFRNGNSNGSEFEIETITTIEKYSTETFFTNGTRRNNNNLISTTEKNSLMINDKITSRGNNLANSSQLKNKTPSTSNNATVLSGNTNISLPKPSSFLNSSNSTDLKSSANVNGSAGIDTNRKSTQVNGTVTNPPRVDSVNDNNKATFNDTIKLSASNSTMSITNNAPSKGRTMTRFVDKSKSFTDKAPTNKVSKKKKRKETKHEESEEASSEEGSEESSTEDEKPAKRKKPVITTKLPMKTTTEPPILAVFDNGKLLRVHIKPAGYAKTDAEVPGFQELGLF